MKASPSIQKCLFPVAGYGTRFLPVTKSIPKEMLPIVNKPLVQYGVEEAMAAGFTDIGFVTGRGKRAIAEYFDFSHELEHEIQGTDREKNLHDVNKIIESCRFSFTHQLAMKGLGHAVLSGQVLMGEHPFGVVLADDLCISESQGVLSQLKDIFCQHACSVVAVEEVPETEAHKFGIVVGEEIEKGIIRVHDMVEKPAAKEIASRLAIIGRYILTPDIFDILKTLPPGRDGEVQLTDALRQQAQQGQVLALRFQGQRFDCGSLDGFVAATDHVYKELYRNRQAGVA